MAGHNLNSEKQNNKTSLSKKKNKEKNYYSLKQQIFIIIKFIATRLSDAPSFYVLYFHSKFEIWFNGCIDSFLELKEKYSNVR